MNLELELLTEELAIYKYYPEGKATYGRASIERISGKVEIFQKAKNHSGMYTPHIYGALTDFQKSGNFPERYQVAWY